MRLGRAVIGVSAVLLLGLTVRAAAGVVSYQGRVELGGSPYSGTGYFKFAIVDASGSTTYWSNDGTSVGGGQPTASVSLAVTDALFDVLLGDATLANMSDLPGAVFPIGGSLRMLRVWFSTTNVPGSFAQLAPDRRVASVPWALQAEQAQSASSAPSVVPFSSGVIVPASVTASQPAVMGFGSSSNAFFSPVQFGRFAFSAPSNGTLVGLRVSADAHFVPNTAQAQLDYVFTIMRSPGASGLTTTYVPIALSAIATFAPTTFTTYPVGAYVTASGVVQGSIPITAGDRLVLQVSSNMPGTPPALDELSFQAGLLLIPAP
jgi:hypothetical protein